MSGPAIILVIYLLTRPSLTLKCSDLTPPTYDPMIPPDDLRSVKVGYAFRGLDNIDITSQSFHLKMVLLLMWHDEKLDGSDNLYSWIGKSLDSMKHCFWQPTVVIEQLDKSTMLGDEIHPEMFSFFPGELFVKSLQLDLVVSCDMDLTWFPWDTQTCYLNIISMKVSHIDLVWDDQLLTAIESTYKQESSYNVKSITQSTGQNVTDDNSNSFQTMLTVTFVFSRRLGMYLISLYFPSTLLVIMAFLSFWIPVTAAPARVTLLITSLLALLTQLSGFRSGVNRITTIDIWFLACISFVSLAIIEFVIAFNRPRSGATVVIPLGRKFTASRSKRFDLDKISRKLFFLCFIIWTIIYWCSFLIYRK